MTSTYLDFDLEIGIGQGREYPVVVRSPAGEARATMTFPFDDLVLENRLLILQNVLLRSGGTQRQALNQDELAVRDFGKALFDATLVEEVRSLFYESRRMASQRDAGLRIRLRMASPSLAALPWEFLYDVRQGHICLSANTPVVRYLELPQPPQPLAIIPPLRILGMVTSPSDRQHLDLERERSRLEKALEPLRAKGLVEITWLEGQTWRDLQRAMRRGPWHVFHFAGHGGFDANTDEGVVLLADDEGRSRPMRATELGRLLADHRPMRLAVLNACEGGHSSERDIFSSTASILVRAGLPAVLAMQYEITDRAAIELTRAFYEALADELPVDAALAEARKAMSLAMSNSFEWGTPVLYMRAPDGVLFELGAASSAMQPAAKQEVAQPPSRPAPPPAARPATAPPLGIHDSQVFITDAVESVCEQTAVGRSTESRPKTTPITETNGEVAGSRQYHSSQQPSRILAIDLGTTNSFVAVIEQGKPVVIPSSEGDRSIPSVVAINRSGERLVGQNARRQAATSPGSTVFSVKRLMGRKFSDPEVQKSLDMLPYEIIECSNGDVGVVMGGKEYSPAEISAMVLRKIKCDAEQYLGATVTQAVITVPAHFGYLQRRATKDAGRIAGIEVLDVINEPTASALACGLDPNADTRVAVYHLGGGTFDISILDVGGGGVFEVRSTNGDAFLGGDDFDQRVIVWLADEFRKKHGIDLRQDRMARGRLKEAAEKAKIELSTVMQTEINLPFITADASGPRHLQMTLSRSKLEQLTADLVVRTIELCRLALIDSRLASSDIGEVILVGGQTRMPAVQEAVRNFFGSKPHKSVKPDETVAMGATIRAGVLGGEVRDVPLLLDMIPLSLGIETLGGKVTPLIERNSCIPTRKSLIFSTAANNQTSIEIKVVEGERAVAGENILIGKFILDGIAPAERGVARIEVTFDIDDRGELKVTAKDLGTSKLVSLTFQH